MSRTRPLLPPPAPLFDTAGIWKGPEKAVVFRTEHGALLKGDCIKLLKNVESACVDTVFADPPFNIGKDYGTKVNDQLATEEYLAWCKTWMTECERILKPGGAFFLYNLPKWNIILGNYMLDLGLDFRHWIAISIKLILPIPNRLYPAHYSLLYYTKGKPKTFRKIRTPIETCRHCGKELKDYGGHRNAMNVKGVNLMDVWTDIPPVRHWKFKSEKRKANALSTKLLDRVIEMSTVPGDMVFDPFGGSGTTFAVAERKHRRWMGCEIEYTDVIEERLGGDDLHHHANTDVIDA